MGGSVRPDPLDAAWESAQQNPLDAAWDAQQVAQARSQLGTRRLPLPGAPSDVTREVGGLPDPEAWKTTIHKPGFIERNVVGAVGLPFAMAAHPVETTGAMLKSMATDPFKPGMYVAKKLNERVGLPAPSDRFNVSGEEAAQSALNTAMMVVPALLKGTRSAPVEVAAEAPRIPRAGIGRIAAADVVPRTEPVTGMGSLLDRLRTPEATPGDVPVRVPTPPAERAYPLGATTGDLVEKGVRKPFTEPAPTPYTRPGVVRRPAGEIPPSPLDAAFDAAQRGESPVPEAAAREMPAPASVPSIGEPVSFGRDLAEPGRIPTGPKPPKGQRYPVVGADELPAPDTAIAKSSGGSWKDLSEAPDEALQTELNRIHELHAQEEASIAFTQTPEWAMWENLPDKEKFNRNVSKVDQHGNVLKRNLEDLPDASGTMDPDVLDQNRKTLKAYNARTMMRNGELRRAEAIAAEQARRAQALEGAPTMPPDEHAAYVESLLKDAPPDAAPADPATAFAERQSLLRQQQGPQMAPTPPIDMLAKSREMLEVGKRRAAELEQGIAPVEAPDLTPALDRERVVTTPEPVAEPSPKLAAVEGTGEVKARGLAAGVDAKAVASQLTDSLGDLPEYRTINMAEQAAKATKLLAENPELAHRIARGEALPPNDLLPESVFTAVENQALANGDVGTLRALASGDLTTQATTMGQRIRALAERNPESPVAAMEKIVKARTSGVKNAGQAMAQSVAELQRHIAEAAKMDPPAWTKFIDGLRC